MAELKRWKTDPLRIDQAIVVAESERMLTQSDPRVQKRAVDKLKLIAKSSEIDAAQSHGKTLLSRIDPGWDATAQPSSVDNFRTWTAKAGNFSKEAKLRQANATHVQLEDRDGQLLTAKIDQLSDADRSYIRGQPSP